VKPPTTRLSLQDLRQLFNTEVLPKIRAGELLEMVRSTGNPSPHSGEPPGTLSQIVEYWEASGSSLTKVAIIHRYLRPDGSLGASGLPDPKRVLHEGVLYAPRVPPSH
jgi:hypothetical protein